MEKLNKNRIMDSDVVWLQSAVFLPWSWQHTETIFSDVKSVGSISPAGKAIIGGISRLDIGG